MVHLRAWHDSVLGHQVVLTRFARQQEPVQEVGAQVHVEEAGRGRQGLLDLGRQVLGVVDHQP